MLSSRGSRLRLGSRHSLRPKIEGLGCRNVGYTVDGGNLAPPMVPKLL